MAGTLLRWATKQFDFSEPKLTESLAFHDQRFDVIYVGDSLTLEGVNARAIDRILGTHSYNLALGGASILESEVQLRHFLANNPKPRLVALGLYVNQPNRPAGVRPTLYFGLSAGEKALYRRKLMDFENTKLDLSYFAFNALPAYRYRNTVDLLLKAALSPQQQRPVFVQGQAQVLFSRPAYLGGTHDSVMDVKQLQSFIAFCREQALPLFLFEPPNHDGYSSLTRNRAAQLKSIDALAAEGPNVWLTSYGDSGRQYSNSDWVNLNHLNLAGSVAFSRALAASLRSHLLPDPSDRREAARP